MLGELEEDVDGVSSRMAAAQRKMKQVLDKAGIMGQIGIILALVGIIILLVWLAFT